MSEVAVLSTPEMEQRLCQWLCAAGHTALPWRESGLAEADPGAGESGSVGGAMGSATWRLPGQGTLVSYFPEPMQTETKVTDEILARLPVASVWLQLGPMVLTRGLLLAARARGARTTYLHAPYLQDPELTERPCALVYGPQAVTSRGRANGLLRALSHHAVWVGPLERSGEPSGHHAELREAVPAPLPSSTGRDGI